MSEGYIYMLRPEKNKNTLKIGRTICLSTRISQHKREWPNLELLFSFKASEHKSLEHCIHKNLRAFRVGSREVYRVCNESASEIVMRFKTALFAVNDSDWCLGEYKRRAKAVEAAVFGALGESEQTVSEVRA